jgi:hypothetical protein
MVEIKTAPEARPPEQSRTAARGRRGQFACPAFRCLNQPAALSRNSAISCEYLPSDPAHALPALGAKISRSSALFS